MPVEPMPIDVVVGVETCLLGAGVVKVLDSDPDLVVVAHVAAANDALEAIRARRPRVAVLDVRYQRGDPDFLAKARNASPDTAFLTLVDHGEDECLLRHVRADDGAWVLSDDALLDSGECCLMALRNHALGCCPQDVEPEDLLAAVHTVAQGRISADRWLQARWKERRRQSTAVWQEPRAVTPREAEVMRLVARGLSNKAIATRLDIKEQTVKNHLRRIMQKLEVDNRVEVALAVRERNLA